MSRYNVEVQGVLVWIEWTTSRTRAIDEYLAWRHVEDLVGPLGARMVVRDKLDPG